jgi:hypothetical protein
MDKNQFRKKFLKWHPKCSSWLEDTRNLSILDKDVKLIIRPRQNIWFKDENFVDGVLEL